MSEFQIGLVASLDSSKSKQQLNSDIEALKKQLTTVEVQAKLGKDVVTNLTQQLNAVQINLNNVKVDQTAINNMISQFNTAFSKVNITLFRETYHSVTSRFFSNNACWKLIFAIHFISPTRLNKILFFYCIIMHYPV